MLVGGLVTATTTGGTMGLLNWGYSRIAGSSQTATNTDNKTAAEPPYKL